MSTTSIFSGRGNVVQGRFQRSVLVRLVDRIRTWNDDRVAIRQLNALSDRLLQDIGIERENIAEAVRQPHPHTGVAMTQHRHAAGTQEDFRKAA